VFIQEARRKKNRCLQQVELAVENTGNISTKFQRYPNMRFLLFTENVLNSAMRHSLDETLCIVIADVRIAG